MSARRKLIAALAEDSLGGIATLADVAHAEQLADAHDNEVAARTLREAADLTERRTGPLHEQRVLLDFATQLRREANAREEATAPAATATPEPAGPATKWPADWDHTLDTAIHTWGGDWDTKRVQRLYLARYSRGLFRSHARDCLSRRARQGLMTLHDQPDRRFYTLTARTTQGETS